MKLKNIVKNKTAIYWIIFVLYGIINLALTLLHEPWRDEVHAWLMAKELSIVDLFLESRFDGHPILWHLLLMPFAKLNFPIITLNLISFIMMLISTWLFLFKTKLPLPVKIFAIFTIPFTYTYSAISRNYSCIILLLVIIGVFYPQRSKHPIIYSILIALLIHTHSLAWGIVAGLTITFHFCEIFKYFYKKQYDTNIKSVIIGLLIIVFNTLLVVFQLYGTSNINYSCENNPFISVISWCIVGLLILLYIYTVFVLKNHYKEFIILVISLGFQIFIYKFVYSSILFQRYILFFGVFLFYLIIVFQDNNFDDLKHFILCISFVFITLCFGANWFLQITVEDIFYPYSSAQEMADFINNNVPKETTILIDASVIGQSIIPYLDDGYSFYDIGYKESVDCANVAYDIQVITDALSNLDAYRGNYIIISNNICELENCEFLYHTQEPLVNESFSLYFIPE